MVLFKLSMLEKMSSEINRNPTNLEWYWRFLILLHAPQTPWCNPAEICFEVSLEDHEEIDHLYKIMFFFGLFCLCNHWKNTSFPDKSIVHHPTGLLKPKEILYFALVDRILIKYFAIVLLFCVPFGFQSFFHNCFRFVCLFVLIQWILMDVRTYTN